MRAQLAALPGILVAVCLIAEPAKPALPLDGLAGVNAALQAGQADRALTLLNSLPPPESSSADAHNLRCRVLFTLEQFETARNECEQAVTLDPQNSAYHLWFGRTLGEVADRANFLNAYGLAKRARSEFEQAVQLNPRNAEALAASLANVRGAVELGVRVIGDERAPAPVTVSGRDYMEARLTQVIARTPVLRELDELGRRAN